MQRLWNRAQTAGEHKRGFAYSWPLMAWKHESVSRDCAFPAQAPWRKHFNTSLYVTKVSNSQVENDRVYCKISTGTMVQHFYGSRLNLLAKRKWSSCIHANTFTVHAFCISVKSSLHYRYMCFSHLCPSNTLCFNRLHKLAQLVLLWFKTGHLADSTNTIYWINTELNIN